MGHSAFWKESDRLQDILQIGQFRTSKSSRFLSIRTHAFERDRVSYQSVTRIARADVCDLATRRELGTILFHVTHAPI